MEEVEQIKYLGVVWKETTRYVHLKKMADKAEEWPCWKGDMDVQSDWTGGSWRRMVMELIGRPSVEDVAVVWWLCRANSCRKLELAQMRMGRRLLVASNTVTWVAGMEIWDGGSRRRGDESVVW